MKSRRELVSVSGSALLFLICLTQNGFYLNGFPWPGWQLLLIGWLELIWWAGIPYQLLKANWSAILAPLFKTNWLANPALFLAYIFLLKKQYTLAIVMSYLSVIFAVSFLTRRTISADTTADITGYGIGYWLWLANTIIMALSSSYLFYVSKRKASILAGASSKKSE